jgi:hypothetical protein
MLREATATPVLDGADRVPQSLTQCDGQRHGSGSAERLQTTGGVVPRPVVWKWPLMQHHIEPPMIRGLVLLRHRLAASVVEQNRLRLAQIHLAPARLPQSPSEAVQSGSGQAETPEATTSEASSTSSLAGRLSWLETA